MKQGSIEYRDSIVISKDQDRMSAAYARALNSPYKVFLAAFIISLPVTNAFAWSIWLPLPLSVIFAFLVLYIAEILYSRRVANLFGTFGDTLLLAFLVSLYIASSINIDAFAIKQFNHLLSYTVVIGAYYFGAMILTRRAKVGLNEIIFWITVAVIFASVFGIVEFAGKNIFNYDVDPMIPRNVGTRYNPTYAGVVVRARAFMSESGNFALFLELFAPLVIAHWFGTGRKVLGGILSLVVMTALVTTFSAAAVAGLSFGMMFALIVYLATVFASMKISRSGLKTLILCLFGVALLAIMVARNMDSDFVSGITSKLTFSYSSVDDPESRLARWRAVLPFIAEHPVFGLGPGGFLGSDGSGQGIVSWWLQIIVEGGLVSAALFFSFYVSVFIKALRIRGIRKYAYIISLGAGAAHYSVISDYWLPWIWFLFVVITMESRQSGVGRLGVDVSGKNGTARQHI